MRILCKQLFDFLSDNRDAFASLSGVVAVVVLAFAF
jgi:hypothetical protein